jgi:hypothetical protein
MTQRGAMIITWGEPRPGVPNSKGLEVFATALGYYDELQKEGRISGYRVYASTSRDRGCLVIEGELETLAQIHCEEESMKQLALGSAVVQQLEVELCIGGSADDVTGFYTNAVTALAEAGLAT